MARPRGTHVTKTRLFLGNAELADATRLARSTGTTLSRYVTEALRRYNAAQRRHRPPPAQGAPQAAPRAA